MDSQNSVTSQNRQAGPEDNPSNNQPIQSNDYKPVKSISTTPAIKTPRKLKRNRELLEAQFPAQYIANGLNGSKTYKAIRKGAKDTTARTEASLILAKPHIQQAIIALLPSVAVESRLIRDAITREPEMPLSWSDKHKFLRTSLELKGLLGDTAKSNTNVNIAMVIRTKE